MMKRILLVIAVLIPGLLLAGNHRKDVSRTRIASVISECRSVEGVEFVHLGRFAVSALKGVARVGAIDDPDLQEALKIGKGIRGISVLSYEDCSESDRRRISRKLDHALAGSEMLMEAGDSGERVRFYGVVDEQADRVRDFVLYAPSDCALICLFGSISMEDVAKLASND